MLAFGFADGGDDESVCVCVCVSCLSGTVFAFDIKTHKTLKLPHFVDITRVSSLSGATAVLNNNLRITSTDFTFMLCSQKTITNTNTHTRWNLIEQPAYRKRKKRCYAM